MIYPLVSLIAAASATTYTVTMGSGFDLTFKPSTLDIKVGDTVDFFFSAKKHSVTQSVGTSCKTFAGGFDSGLKTSKDAEKYSWTFKEAGVYNYICDIDIHCNSGMKGVVTVV